MSVLSTMSSQQRAHQERDIFVMICKGPIFGRTPPGQPFGLWHRADDVTFLAESVMRGTFGCTASGQLAAAASGMAAPIGARSMDSPAALRISTNASIIAW